jgi:hypothetical protein
MLHQKSALAHASLLIRSYLAICQISVVPYPPYSTDLVPAGFFLFPQLKTTSKGRSLQTIEEVQENTRELRVITESAFQEVFQEWKTGWKRCIASRGDYIEDGSA